MFISPTSGDGLTEEGATLEYSLSSGSGTAMGSNARAGVPDMSRQRQVKQYYKTRLCPHYVKGFCKKGESCSYAHSDDELRPSINLDKTKLCQEFLFRRCTKNGRECRFAHGETELRSTPYYYKSQICKYWMNGHCNAENCRYVRTYVWVRDDYRPLRR
eukprot:GHVU01221644.1.p1 GENE.GHVU01221644.1~~GHVU01221644.1.p1  ORF type:complete len:159 (-),score=16.74 GHVU01221644.1:407-883(-)